MLFREQNLAWEGIEERRRCLLDEAREVEQEQREREADENE